MKKVKKPAKKVSDAVSLLSKALKQFDKFQEEDLYGYSNVGLKMERSAKRVQKEIKTFLNN